MINWMFFPKNQTIDKNSKNIISIFKKHWKEIDSFKHTNLHSDEVLSIVKNDLLRCSFQVEKGKKLNDKIKIPVLYGLNGEIEKSFDADAYYKNAKYIIEVEAGRAVLNYQFLKDFFEACVMLDVSKLCIAVKNKYRNSNDFDEVCKFFEILFLTNKMSFPLESVLIIGY